MPRAVWALGLVSLLMDMSSEMIHSLLPLYLVVGLGAGALTVGLIEGIGEATASIVRILSGTLSDWSGRRKPLVLAGYGLAAATKPVFPFAGSVGWIVAARVVDRVGKGIREVPRDALIADLTPPGARGATYGLRQALDTVGAIAGPLLAILLMTMTEDAFRVVFWFATVPAMASVTVLAIAVPEPARPPARMPRSFPMNRAAMRRMGRGFWVLVGIAAILTLARFSEAFLILHAGDVGMALAHAPLVMVIMNIAYAASSYPVGRLSDRIGRTGLLTLGVAVLIVSDVVFAVASGMAALVVGALLWGLHMGLSQGLLAALVADGAPADLRGTAFGVYHLVTGLALLAASVTAGVLWQVLGPPATFAAGAVFALVAMAAWIAWRVGGGGVVT